MTLGKASVRRGKQRKLKMTNMRKLNLSVRLAPDLFTKLEELGQVTGMNTSELAREAIAQYCDMDVEAVGSRLTRLERELESLQRKFRMLGGSM